MTTISTDAIRDHYRGHGHWFDKETLRFFRSRIGELAYDDGNGRAYFVTSEQFVQYEPRYYVAPRKYTVRCYTWSTHHISTVGEFQAYASRSGANAAAERLARHGAGEAVGV
jgi:hypothetical protein